MKLLFDVGNTRIKWAMELDGRLLEAGSVTHRGISAADAVGFVAKLTGSPSSAWAVNVAGPDIEAALRQAVMARFNLSLRLARTTAAYGGVTNGYTNYEQLGADRWAAIVACGHRFKRPICVVDIGTAVTIDLVREGGAHQGGIILPGLQLMLGALRQDTSDIDIFANSSRGDVPDGDWFGRDTLTAIHRGALFALRAAITEAARSLDDGRPLVILTGGDAPQVGELAGCDTLLEPDLVLHGLALLSVAEEP